MNKMNKFFKLGYHSLVDIITNSSTVIFTYSEGAVDTVISLINEILKLEGSDKKAQDLFYIDTFLEDDWRYKDHEECPEDLDELISDILEGKLKKPQWMNDVEEDNGDWYRPSTSLYIKAKDEKYSKLANKLLSYLYSTDHEATRDG